MNENARVFQGIVEKIPSIQFGDYYGVIVPEQALQAYFEALESVSGDGDRYMQLRNNRKNRDGDDFHITIVSPIERDKVSEEDLASLPGQKLSFQLIGLGTVSLEEDTTYFVVVESEQAQTLRAKIGLAPKDLHVTLGFDKQDIYNVPKNRTTLVCLGE